jgi:hypothetical protein
MPRLEGKPHFKRWGMLGVAAMWAQEAQKEQAGDGPSTGYKRHWWIPKEGIEEYQNPFTYFTVHLPLYFTAVHLSQLYLSCTRIPISNS